MKDDAQGMPLACIHAADAMAHIYAIEPPRAVNRALGHGKDHGVALFQRDHLGTALHAWALLGEDELAAGKIFSRLGQKNGHLQWKHLFAIQVLVQAVVVTGCILQ